MNAANVHPMRDARWWSRAIAPSTEWQFFTKVDGDGDPEQCWPWLASTDQNGYGAFVTAGKRHMAHRWAYRHLIGDFPDDLQLDHLCHNRGCVNPWHLDPVTAVVNSSRRRRAAA